MMQVVFCENGALSIRSIANPRRRDGETLIRVARAGICSTDLEIVKGYVPGFSGVPGHEFFGSIEEAADPALTGKRATAEINCACGACDYCKAGLRRHCPSRTVLGILNRQGCFADYVAVPDENVFLIPDEIPDSSAVLIEPLAAALEIFEQITLSPEHEILLIGDGRLAQLIAATFLYKEYALTVVGKHREKLALLEKRGARTILLDDFSPSKFDIVIEASGARSGFDLGLACTKPRGTLVLKSTYAGAFPFNPSPIVVDEITLLGSRCGRFEESLRFLLNFRPDFSYLITGRYPLSRAIEAFERAREKDALKVIIEVG